MRGIKIKVTGANQNVFRVGCFQNNKAPGLKRPHCFVEKTDQSFQREMFHKVKRRDCAQTIVSLCSHMRYGLCFSRLESSAPTLLDHDPAGINSASGETSFFQDFQPFAPTAADIHDVRSDIGVFEY